MPADAPIRQEISTLTVRKPYRFCYIYIIDKIKDIPLFDNMKKDSIISDQIEYYRRRAEEYDEWHRREGRYNRGEEHREQWFKELDIVRSALTSCAPFGNCLELACGTGLWTGDLAQNADSVLALDSSPEMIEFNRSHVRRNNIQYRQADIFKWSPESQYDFIFFGFWLSHVPRDEFRPFWEKMKKALRPNGMIFFVDSLKTQDSTAVNHKRLDNSGVVERKLNDGRTFHIVKIFYEPEKLMEKLAVYRWQGEISKTGEFFYYGIMKPI